MGLLLLLCLRLSSARRVYTFPQVARKAKGTRAATSRKPSLFFMPGHASFPGLHCCRRLCSGSPSAFCCLEPTVGPRLAPIAGIAAKCWQIWKVTDRQDCTSSSLWIKRSARTVLRKFVVFGEDLSAKEERRGEDGTEQQVRIGNMGLRTCNDSPLQIVSVLRRELSLEGLRHSGYVRASLRHGESQLGQAWTTTSGG